MTFGHLVDAARRGTMSRRGFLSAALALGVGAAEAERERDRRIVQVTGPQPSNVELFLPNHAPYLVGIDMATGEWLEMIGRDIYNVRRNASERESDERDAQLRARLASYWR